MSNCVLYCGMDIHTERLVSVETKLAFLEDYVDRLQAILVEHTGTIDRIIAENKALRSKISDVEESIQDMPDQRPPHY